MTLDFNRDIQGTLVDRILAFYPDCIIDTGKSHISVANTAGIFNGLNAEGLAISRDEEGSIYTSLEENMCASGKPEKVNVETLDDLISHLRKIHRFQI